MKKIVIITALLLQVTIAKPDVFSLTQIKPQKKESRFTLSSGCSSLWNDKGTLRCDKMPEGSYRTSCRNCTITPDGMLTCECDVDGEGLNFKMSSVRAGCAAYWNNKGQLTCNIPEGTFKGSCGACRVEGDILICEDCAS